MARLRCDNASEMREAVMGRFGKILASRSWAGAYDYFALAAAPMGGRYL